jgi:uncharacterized protein (DUF1684 family)
MSATPVDETLALLDWRRQIAELYASIRAEADARPAWAHWQHTRSRLFSEHPQSPVPSPDRGSFSGPHVYPYDPAWRALGEVKPSESKRFELPTSTGQAMSFDRFARALFSFGASELSLELYQVQGYGGGLFVPFADATSGGETYGAGRYLLDTVKGSDLGQQNDRLVLDFNFAYQPSCSYDPRWTCPLAPPGNRLPLAVRAGERLAAA